MAKYEFHQREKKEQEKFKGERSFFWLRTSEKALEKRHHSRQDLTDGIRWKKGHAN